MSGILASHSRQLADPRCTLSMTLYNSSLLVQHNPILILAVGKIQSPSRNSEHATTTTITTTNKHQNVVYFISEENLGKYDATDTKNIVLAQPEVVEKVF